jgi:malonyl-CoA O-methyltransferase
MTIQIPSKKQIAMAFSRRASRYGANAFVQKIMLESCVGFIKRCSAEETKWLDAGSGIGMFNDILQAGNFGAEIISLDIAFGALEINRNLVAVNADMEKMPFSNGVFDGVVAASSLQWIDNIKSVIEEITRITVKNGLFVFALFENGSFFELYEIMSGCGIPVPVRYHERLSFERLLKNSGFDILEFKSEKKTVYFSSAREILRYFSNIGATATAAPRLKRQRPEIEAICSEYEKKFSTDKGFPLTVVTGCGIAGKRNAS